jgi:hypothetical protein
MAQDGATIEGTRELRLFVEPLDGDEDAARASSELQALVVPDGVHAFELDETILFEPIDLEGRVALAMTTPRGRRVRLNGASAPRVSVLRVGDQVQLEDVVLHVTYMRRPRVGPPPKTLVGKPCGLCSVPFTETSTVVAHDCNTYLHLEPEEGAAGDPLRCALLGCPVCNEPVSLEDGYAYEPEL